MAVRHSLKLSRVKRMLWTSIRSESAAIACLQPTYTHTRSCCEQKAVLWRIKVQPKANLFFAQHTHTHTMIVGCAHHIIFVWFDAQQCSRLYRILLRTVRYLTHTHTRSHWIFVRPKRMRANEQKERWKTSRVPEISKNKPMPVAHIHNRKQIIVLVVSHPSTMPMCHLPLALNFITAHSNTHRNKLSLYIFQQIRTRHTSTKALNTNYNYNL